MAMENGGLSASDVALMTNHDGFGGDGWGGMIWLFAILAMMGGGFNGFGNRNAIGFENLATQAQVDRGFDTQNMMANQRETLAAVNAGTAQAVAATNQSFHDMLAATQNLYNELQRDIASLAVGQANALANQNQCCCETKQLIQQVNYDGAMRDAATNANFTAQIQSVKDMIAQDKIDTLQNKVNQLELQSATANVLRYPTSWTYNAGMSPFCGCGCGVA